MKLPHPPFRSSGFDEPRSVRWVGLAIVLLILLAYGNTFSGEIVLDDEMSVVENFSIRRLSDLGTVLSPPADSTVGGRPIANLSFAFNYAIGGLQVHSYHLGNLILHGLAALLLFGVVRRTLMGRPEVLQTLRLRTSDDAAVLAGAVAAMWAVHPVLTSAVTYIAQRTEVLMGTFYLLTLYAFVRGIPERAARWRWFSVAACALGMASKEVMVTAPCVVLLYDRVFVSGSFAAAWRARRGYYLALGATWLLLGYLMTTGLNQRGVGFGIGVSAWRYALTECNVLLRYLQLALWPQPLVFDYGPSFVSGFAAALPSILGLIVLLGGVGLAVVRRPMIGFLALGFFLVLAPTSSVVPVATQPMAESRLYVPLAFAVTLGGVGFAWVLGRWRRGGLAVMVIGLALQAHARNTVLVDPARLWPDTLAKVPDNARAHVNYGAWLFARGRTVEAMAHERRGLELDPKMPRAYVNLAAALASTGDHAAALAYAQQALKLASGMSDINYQIGNALIHLGRPAESIPHYEAEIRIRPDYANAYLNLGSAYYLLGRPADAIRYLETALRLDPQAANVRENLAGALVQAGRKDEGIALYRAALQARPEAIATRCNLAIALAQAGRIDEAEAEFATALRQQPDYAPAQRGVNDMRALRAAQAPRRSEGR